jgi:hypothetical protein
LKLKRIANQLLEFRALFGFEFGQQLILEFALQLGHFLPQFLTELSASLAQLLALLVANLQVLSDLAAGQSPERSASPHPKLNFKLRQSCALVRQQERQALFRILIQFLKCLSDAFAESLAVVFILIAASELAKQLAAPAVKILGQLACFVFLIVQQFQFGLDIWSLQQLERATAETTWEAATSGAASLSAWALAEALRRQPRQHDESHHKQRPLDSCDDHLLISFGMQALNEQRGGFGRLEGESPLPIYLLNPDSSCKFRAK